MESRTCLLWFQLDRAATKEIVANNNNQSGKPQQRNELLERIRELPGAFTTGKWTMGLEHSLEDGSIVFLSYNSSSHASMRLYPDGLLTFDIQSLAPINENKHGKSCTLPNLKIIRSAVGHMVNILGTFCVKSKSIDTPIFRGMDFSPYTIGGDERLLHRDFTALLHESDSRWQNIKIYKSAACGGVLYLDDDVMLGESDLVYTETLLGLDRNDYTDKTVLILGGGDGGLVHELVTRKKPKFVTMVEIDEEVIKACRTHMRQVCGNTLDEYKGSNYEIIIGDCVKHLKESIAKNATYDYVVNDLTEFDVDKDAFGFEYDFSSANIVMELSIMVLSPYGKYLSRGNTMSSYMYRDAIEKNLKQLDLQYTTFVRYVPSFLEDYFFVEAWKNTPPS